MNDTIFNGRDVTKNATYRVEAFQSRDLGRSVTPTETERSSTIHHAGEEHTVNTEFDVRNLQSLPRVDIVVSYVGADGKMIEAAAAAGAKGIVAPERARADRLRRKTKPSTGCSRKRDCSCVSAAESRLDGWSAVPALRNAASSPATIYSRGKPVCCWHWL